MAAVRTAEIAVAATRGAGAGLQAADGISAAQWREHWMDRDAAGVPRSVAPGPEEPQ